MYAIFLTSVKDGCILVALKTAKALWTMTVRSVFFAFQGCKKRQL